MPGSGLHARYCSGRGLQPHRAVQPRDAPNCPVTRKLGEGRAALDAVTASGGAVGRAEGAGDGADRRGGGHAADATAVSSVTLTSATDFAIAIRRADA